jgi:hypothetical protein
MRRSRRINPVIPSVEEKQAHLSHLEYRVRRNPHDLLAHVQRFSLYKEQADVQACFDVLVDLFLVLGRRGHPLRERLFSQIEPELSEENRQLLRAHMDSGLQRTDILPALSRSCLSLGISGAVNLVTPEHTEGEEDIDMLEFARQRLAKGDYELTQVLLERMLDDDPSDATISLQLLKLYQECGLFQDFMLTYARLADRNLAELASWRKVEQQFRDSLLR